MAIFSAIGAAVAWGVGFLGAAAGLSVATAVTLGTVAGYAAIAASATLLARLLRPDINIPTADIQANLNQTDGPRRVFFGRNLAGGIRALWEVRGGILYQIIVMAHGRIDGYERFWIDGEPQELDSSDNWWGLPQPVRYPRDGEWSGWVNVVTRDGQGEGGDYPVVRSQFASVWGTDRRLQDQATFLVGSKAPKPEDFSKIFPKGANTLFQWEFRGGRMLDPRNGLVSYSENAALIFRFYMSHPDGFRIPLDMLDDDNISAMADVSDVGVPQRGGGMAPSLRLWGYWTMDEDPVQVLDRLTVSSGLRAYEMQNGKIGLIGGPYGEPAMTLTTPDIKAIRVLNSVSEKSGYNVLRVFYMSGEHNYEVVECDEWRDEDRIAVEGEIVEELRMEHCPNLSQARRRGKQQIHDDNRSRIELITNLVGLKARFPRQPGQRHTILLDYRPQNGGGRVITGEFEVVGHEFDPQELECKITLAKVSRNRAQAWNAETMEGDKPELPADLRDNEAPTIPTSVTLVKTDGGGAFLRVTAIIPDDRPDVYILARYREVGDTRWSNMTGGQDGVADSSPVDDQTTYEVEVQVRGIFRGAGVWTPLGTITTQFDSTPPGAPRNLNVTNVTGGAGVGFDARLTWRNPNTDFEQILIYRGSTVNFNNASVVGETGGVKGQTSTYDDEGLPSGTYNYWVVAVNRSGVPSDPEGPDTITF